MFVLVKAQYLQQYYRDIYVLTFTGTITENKKKRDSLKSEILNKNDQVF